MLHKTTILISFFCCSFFMIRAQDIIPKAKTRAERKAENKKKTLKQKIEDTLPVSVDLPSAPSINLPGDKEVSSMSDAKKLISETRTEAKKKAKLLKSKLPKKKSFDGKNYEGLAVKKKVLKRGSNSRFVYQEFYVLKEPVPTSQYHRSFTWLNLKNNKLVEALTRDTKTNLLLHGPYLEIHGINTWSEGSYYKGLKHGRWLYYDKDFNLLNKEYYNKGFLADSRISYYDADSLKVKEVVPIVFGDSTGSYLKFYEDGTLAEEGKLDHGVRIGKWIEYYAGGNRRKKETQYPKDAFDLTKPYILREYDEKGKIVFEEPSYK
jgi:hypothetical protein